MLILLFIKLNNSARQEGKTHHEEVGVGSGKEVSWQAAVVLDDYGFLKEVLPDLEEVFLDGWREAWPCLLSSCLVKVLSRAKSRSPSVHAYTWR